PPRRPASPCACLRTATIRTAPVPSIPLLPGPRRPPLFPYTTLFRSPGCSVSIPKRALTVVTGLSGSGKSALVFDTIAAEAQRQRSEEHTSELQSRENLVCRLLLEKKKNRTTPESTSGDMPRAALTPS